MQVIKITKRQGVTGFGRISRRNINNGREDERLNRRILDCDLNFCRLNKMDINTSSLM